MKNEYSGKDILNNLEKNLSKYNDWTVSLLTQNAENLSSQNILDFGCGTGNLCEIFFNKFNIRPMAVEIDDGLRKLANGKGIEVFCDLKDVPVKLDLIYSSNVLEHIKDDREILEQMIHKLNGEGQIALYLPAFEILWSEMDDRVGHYRRYNKKMLLKLVEGLPVNVIDIKYVDPVGFFVTLLYKVFGRDGGSPSAEKLKFYDKYIVGFSKILNMVFSKMFGKNILIILKKNAI